MNKVLEYFKNNYSEEIIAEEITVFGWKFSYKYQLISSLTKYLFEELNINENIAPENNTNRDLRIMEKKYICVHDTGDTDKEHTAQFWSNVVKVQDWEQGRYEASFQYVTGNDGIYHNIPDNEIAYHAGDGTKFSYQEIDSQVNGCNDNPIIDISDDGYYTIDGIKTSVLAPNNNGEILDKSKFNSQGILCISRNNRYYLGVTYFNEGYNLIANRGGNCNSIGIESCVNEGSDIYLTWQRTAKLVAKLMNDNDIGIDMVKQHHYFSGKNCPQTMIENKMWDHFIELVKFEYQILKFKEEGYEIELIVDDCNANKNGRILKNSNIKFKVKTKYKGVVEELEFQKIKTA